MRKRAWLVPMLLLAGAGAASCTSLLGDFQPPGSTGQGGGTVASSSSRASSAASGAGGSGGAPECQKDKDCMDPPQACLLPFCDGGVCATKPVVKGTPSPKQIPGDCMKIICDANGASHMVVDTTNSDDLKECTTDSCDADGTPHHVPMNGAHCGNNGTLVCNMAGDCVACIGPSMCPGNGACVGFMCQMASCTDGLKNQDESDVDCGGAICSTRCLDGKKCLVNGDCSSNLCQSKVCRPATCADMMPDGHETDVDCGGDQCLPCPDGDKCTKGTDCVSTLCQAAACRLLTCGNGVHDGNETGVDCGGPDCQKCPSGQPCSLPSDCVSAVCTGGFCT